MGTWKGIGEHRDGTEMGRKKREAKAKNCGERGGGSRGQGRGAQEPPTHGWIPRVGLGTWKRIGEHRDGTEMGRKKRKTTRHCGEGVGGPRGQERGAQDPPPPTMGWIPSVGLGNMEGD